MQLPDTFLFGRHLAEGHRHVINGYALPQRAYLGPTSMDTEMAFIMCNMAQACTPAGRLPIRHPVACASARVPLPGACSTKLRGCRPAGSHSRGGLSLSMHTVVLGVHRAVLIVGAALQVRPGSLVFDPFAGTGSILVAAAQMGAVTLGADIDAKVIRDGRQARCVSSVAFWSQGSAPCMAAPQRLHCLPGVRIQGGWPGWAAPKLPFNWPAGCSLHSAVDPAPSQAARAQGALNPNPAPCEQGPDGSIRDVWSNFAAYGLPRPVGLLRSDSHRPPFRPGLQEVLDAVVCDPPYGVSCCCRARHVWHPDGRALCPPAPVCSCYLRGVPLASSRPSGLRSSTPCVNDLVHRSAQPGHGVMSGACCTCAAESSSSRHWNCVGRCSSPPLLGVPWP